MKPFEYKSIFWPSNPEKPGHFQIYQKIWSSYHELPRKSMKKL